jgi:hypothetical protein
MNTTYSRIPFMMAAVLNLVVGIWSGLIRIGWELPATSLAVHHGAIMVGGFLSTLIALEKVIPLKRKIAYVVPVLSALSIVMVLPGYFELGLYFLLAGSIGLFLIQSYYMYQHPHDITMMLMLVGAGCLIVGNSMLMHMRFYPAAFPWWMGFLLFTITAERLDLSKFLPVSMKMKYLLLGFMLLFLVGLIVPFHGVGKYISGISMICIALWMLRHDVMRIGIRKEGLTRFSSVALLMANTWLIMNSLFLFVLPDSVYSYDILVHSFFIGYAFTMIFAHGPIILPGVLGITNKPYHPVLYVWIFLVQGSLLLRLAADALLHAEWRKISALLMTAGILLYFISLVFLIIKRRNLK